MQRVINYAVRLVEHIPRRESTVLKSRELHWLLIRKRIAYRVLTLLYAAFHRRRPLVLGDLFQFLPSPSQERIFTRSANDPTLLEVPRTKTRVGDSAFRVFAPRTWNGIPRELLYCFKNDSR
jgi:hypothetical protein